MAVHDKDKDKHKERDKDKEKDKKSLLSKLTPKKTPHVPPATTTLPTPKPNTINTNTDTDTISTRAPVPPSDRSYAASASTSTSTSTPPAANTAASVSQPSASTAAPASFFLPERHEDRVARITLDIQACNVGLVTVFNDRAEVTRKVRVTADQLRKACQNSGGQMQRISTTDNKDTHADAVGRGVVDEAPDELGGVYVDIQVKGVSLKADTQTVRVNDVVGVAPEQFQLLKRDDTARDSHMSQDMDITPLQQHHETPHSRKKPAPTKNDVNVILLEVSCSEDRDLDLCTSDTAPPGNAPLRQDSLRQDSLRQDSGTDSETPKQLKKLERLHKESEALQQHIKRVEAERTWLENLAKQSLGRKDLVTADMTQLTAFMEFIRTNFERLDAEWLKLQDQKTDLNKKISSSKRVIEKLRIKQNKLTDKSNTIYISIFVKDPLHCSIAMDVAYILRDASWRPYYDIRVDSDALALSLTYNSMVINSTDENWNNAKLKLSTAEPSFDGRPPDISTAKVSFEPQIFSNKKKIIATALPKAYTRHMLSRKMSAKNDVPELSGATSDMLFDAVAAMMPHAPPPPPEGYRPIRQVSLRAAAPKIELGENEEEEVCEGGGGVGVLTAAADSSEFGASTFIIPRKATIPSDGEEKRVQIATFDLPTTFTFTTVPQKSENAFLCGTAINKSPFLMLEGSMNVFINSSFVTTSTLDRVVANAEFSVFLGADPSIVVKSLPCRVDDASGGLLSRGQTQERSSGVRIKNTKEKPVQVIVFEQIPLSSSDKIKVRLIDPAPSFLTTPEELQKMQQAGIQVSESLLINEFNNLKRTMTLSPGEERDLKLKYSIEYPKDKEIYVTF